MDVPIHQVPSPKFAAGHPAPLLAIVHHRMVGTLASTDVTFTTGSRVASTHFGIGLCSKHGGNRRLCIHQYVALGDQAFGNGNNRFGSGPRRGQLVDSRWNSRYPTTLVNSRTVSIEHHDNGARGHRERGVVPDEVIAASIELDRLLLSGDTREMTAAGIRFRSGMKDRIGRELKAIKPGRHTIVDHHYVSGPLKPHDWRPWAKDRNGFPHDRFVAALRGTVAQPRPESPEPLVPAADRGPLRSFKVPRRPTLATVRAGSWLYDNSALHPSPHNVRISPGRDMPLVGMIRARTAIVEYVDAEGSRTGKAFWIEADDVEATRPAR